MYGPGLERPMYRRLGREPLVLGREPGAGGLVLPGTQASRRHAVVRAVPEYDLYRIEDLGSTNGTFVNGERVDREMVRSGSVVRLGDCLLVVSEIPAELPVIPSLGVEEGVAERSLRLEHAEALADRAAPSGLPILVLGPTGAGKERLATRIHERSRRSGPLVVVSCATFPKDMLASELFGHRKGAFTGAAADRVGLIASSGGGTLFLDEIAELPLEQQPALLRVLQEKRVRPVGADHEVPVDLRVVAATHRDLAELEASGGFRGDLRARLEAVRIVLPGLADRREDILPLFLAHLRRDGVARAGCAADHLTLEAAEALLLYDWPKNVREIQQAAAHVSLFWEDAGPIPLRALPPSVAPVPRTVSTEREGPPTPARLEALLLEHRGNVTRVARALGEHRTQVQRWLKVYGFDAASYRGRP